MAKNEYEIKYLPTFIAQLNNILYYIKYELNNKIAADNFYKKVLKEIEARSISPASYEVFRVSKKENVNYYKIRVNNYTIFYTVKGNIMEIRRIYYSKRDFDKLI